MTNFQDLGLSLSLFEAPIKDCSHYAGQTHCHICKTDQTHAFTLGIGCHVVVHCPNCHAEHGLSTSDRKNLPCHECGTVTHFPDDLLALDDIHCCHQCLNEGRAYISKDTELGMIAWEQMLEGMTLGCPKVPDGAYEVVPDSNGWYRVTLTKDDMLQLLKTPNYESWQGVHWLFCCKKPMTFLGEKTAEELEASKEPYAEQMLLTQNGTSCYVFRCSTCGNHRSYWDSD